MLQSISELNSKIDQVYQYDLAPILLEFNAVYEEVTKMNSLWKELKDVSLKVYPIEVKRNSIDIAYQQFDDYLKSSNIEKIKAIKNNLHIIEAVNIINDFKSK
jgi:carboxyl-terminal processing protease